MNRLTEKQCRDALSKAGVPLVSPADWDDETAKRAAAVLERAQTEKTLRLRARKIQRVLGNDTGYIDFQKLAK